MVYVILRNGKMLEYNKGGKILVDHSTVAVTTYPDNYLIAKIPLDVVERAEFERPCRITKESTAWRKRRT